MGQVWKPAAGAVGVEGPIELFRQALPPYPLFLLGCILVGVGWVSSGPGGHLEQVGLWCEV